MEYLKLSLTVDEQADQLIARGLVAEKTELMKRLSAVSYYRLSGYLHGYREKEGNNYHEGTNLTEVWSRYCFDRRLRVLVLDAIERIEVAVRTQTIYHFSHIHGPFGHCVEENLPNLEVKQYIKWRESLEIESSRSKEIFKKHFFKKYGESHQNLPIWMVAELMSMGSLLTLYNGSDSAVQKNVAKHFDLPDALFLTWLRSLYAARNICAHHSRFWNRELGYPPGLPNKNKFPQWYEKDADGNNLFKNNRCGIILMILREMLHKISPSSQWHKRVTELFSEYPDIPLHSMSLPDEWQSHALWQSPSS
jgi:abortive infection bacteriophage resistance protein